MVPSEVGYRLSDSTYIDLKAAGVLQRNGIIPDVIVLISIKFVRHNLTNIFKSGIVMYSYTYNIT
jgi:hypothetical protein